MKQNVSVYECICIWHVLLVYWSNSRVPDTQSIFNRSFNDVDSEGAGSAALVMQIVKEQRTQYYDVDSKGAGSAALVMQIVKEQRTQYYDVIVKEQDPQC